MGTVIERLDVSRGGWRTRHSALHLAVAAAKTCLQGAGREPDDVDLLINAGVYRDKNLAEPALAALIQEDIGANPEDPHDDAVGTFSFDVVIPQSYAVLTETGQLAGDLDGKPYTAPVWLAAGPHEFRRTAGGGRAAIFLADACAKGFRPLLDASEQIIAQYGTLPAGKKPELQ